MPETQSTADSVGNHQNPKNPQPSGTQEDLLAVPAPPLEEKSTNPFHHGGALEKVFDFLASLRVAVVLLSVLGLACIAATITESNTTARIAQRLVYHAIWFDLLLLAVFINVLFATLARLPWRITQLGFLVTHFGILVTLVGAMISHHFGIEGQMTLMEGQAKDRIQLDSTFIGIQKEGDPVRSRFNASEVEWGHPTPGKPQVYELTQLGLKAIVTAFYPDSEWREVWKDDAPTENPAVHFALDSTRLGRVAEGWLAPNMPRYQGMTLGPASIAVRSMADEAALQKEIASTTGTTIQSASESAPMGAEFALLLGPGQKLTWKVTTSAGQVSSGPLIVGQPVPMPMMTQGLNLVVDQQLSHARREEELVERPIKQGESGARAVRMELVNSTGEKQAVWLEPYKQQEITLGGQKFYLVYQNDEAPLGFFIQLKDFRLRHYPGDEARPMSYESDVRVLTEVDGETLTRDNITIMMNKPLDHAGYRIFQSSYLNQPEGDPRISIFSVAYAPGTPLVYTGSLILCLGIALMFYGKPLIKQLDQRWQARKAGGRAA